MAIPLGVGKLGPGLLKIGVTATSIDVSTMLNNAVISAEKDETDATTKLSGDVRAGSTTYTYSLSGNVDTDVGSGSGLFKLSQTSPGTQQDFEFTPSTALTTKAVGKLIIDPLDFGADEMGADLTSDFEWTIVGKPTYTYGTFASDDPTDEPPVDEPPVDEPVRG